MEGAFLVAQLVKNLPAMQETWVRSLGQEDPLEEEMATYSITLAWRIPWREEPGGLQAMGSQSRAQLVFCFLKWQYVISYEIEHQKCTELLSNTSADFHWKVWFLTHTHVTLKCKTII